MKVWYRVHIYDIGPERRESMVGPFFKTEMAARVWAMARNLGYISSWEIKRHTL